MTKNTTVINNLHLPSVIRMDLFTGVSIDVTPVSQIMLVRIQDESIKRYPDPDTKPYEKPLPGAAVEGLIYVDTDDANYLAALRDIRTQRGLWQKEALYMIACQPTPPVSKEDLIEQFKSKLDQIEQYISIPYDPWKATLLYGILIHEADLRAIDNVLMRNAPLTFEEVADGLRIFRTNVSVQNGAAMATDRPSEHGDGAASDGESG